MSTPTLPEELWDIERLVAFLGVSKRFVYRLTSERRIRYYRVAGSLRFDPDDVAAYLSNEAITPTSMTVTVHPAERRRAGRPRATAGAR